MFYTDEELAAVAAKPRNTDPVHIAELMRKLETELKIKRFKDAMK